MNAEELASKCEDWKASGQGKFMARCPAHDDRSASLSIADGDNGGVLVKCFANCETSDVLAALGLKMADLMPDKPLEEKVKPTIVACYDYRNEDGKLVYQAVRMNPKDFRQRRPNPEGEGWVWNLKDIPRVLYRLPDLLDANPKDIVFIAEGEKDCDNLAKHGLLGTTNVGGAGKWKDEYSECLRDRRVCILPDNDAPGVKHANQVAESLKGTAAKVKVLVLPGLPEKGDVSDWFADGGTKEALIAAAIAAPEWDKPIEAPKAREPPAKNGIKVTTLGDAAIEALQNVKAGKKSLIELGIPELDFAIGGGVEAGEMVVLAGLPSHGKSAVALQFIHNWTYANMPCFMVSEEMSPLVLGKRALQFLSEIPEEQWFSDMASVEADLAHYSSKRAKCYIAEPCGDSRIAIEQIDRAVQEYGVKCAVVDYTQHLKGTGGNRYEQVSNTSMAIKNCAKRNNIVLLALAQLNKEIEKRDTFIPRLGDIADSGQIGKDADVVIFQCWPFMLDKEKGKSDYQFFVAKNRNREIKRHALQCEFHPHRQMVTSISAKRMKNYDPSFDSYNES